MPYAIIQTGGKQYRVSQGDRLKIEVLKAEPGQEVELDNVKALGEGATIQVTPSALVGKTVKVRVVRHGRGRKINIIKFKRRKDSTRKQGHRQNFTEVEILSIPAA
jgi:large subunit ribosomal protein L21